MPLSALSAVVATAARSATPPITDGELLRQFVRTREESAFAALVRRLGPMVLGVCRRVSGDRHLAEDAFQAAFVVLARRASAVKPAEAVRAWLYGVAVRTAKGVRAVTARRLAREVPVPAVPDRAGEVIEQPDAEALAILDEEVAGLPEHLRVAVVLCELDGLSRRDAAARLAVAEGTLSSRLAKARRLLADRLRKRGVSLPAAGLGVLLNSANVSARLVATTSAFASASAPLPPAVAALSNGVLGTMFLKKLTAGVACTLALVAVGIAAWNATPEAIAQQRPKAVTLRLVPTNEAAPQPAAKPAGPGTLVVGREGAMWVLTPDGKKLPDLELPENTQPLRAPALSPDGTRIAHAVLPPQAPLAGDAEIPTPAVKILVRKLDGTEAGKGCELTAWNVALKWTPDGKKIVASSVKNREMTDYECVVLDPATGKTEKIDLPANVRVLDCSRDGKTFLVQKYDAKAKKCELGLAKLGDKEVTTLCDLRDRGYRPIEGRFSPDGKRVLFIDGDPERKHAHKWGASQRVYVMDLATKKREPLADFPENGRAGGIAWSPDGKKIAYTWSTYDEELLKKDSILGEVSTKEVEGFLMVADTDGKNAKTLASDKATFPLAIVLGAIDWR